MYYTQNFLFVHSFHGPIEIFTKFDPAQQQETENSNL
jgi:hypothetical protein